MSAAATSPADPTVVLAFDVTVTLEDQIAEHMSVLASPAMRAARLRRAAVTVLVTAAFGPLALVGGILFAWIGDRRGPSLGSMFRSLVSDQPGILAAAVLVMTIIALCRMAVRHGLRRTRLRRALRQTLRDASGRRPAARLSRPRHRQRRGAGKPHRHGLVHGVLERLRRWEETGEHLVVLGAAMAGFCVATSTVDPAALDRLRAILMTRLGPKRR